MLRFSSAHSKFEHQVEVTCQLHIPTALSPGKELTDTLWVENCVDSTAGLDAHIGNETPNSRP